MSRIPTIGGLQWLSRNRWVLGNAHVYTEKAAEAPITTRALSGRLIVSKSGWGLLEVPNALARGAFEALDEQGVELPGGPEFNAHISVLRPEDIEAVGGVSKLVERGRRFRYTLGPVQTVAPAGWDDVSKVWFIKVNSPELEKLRKSYGLSAKPKDNKFEFHITIGIRKKKVLQANTISKAASAEPLLEWLARRGGFVSDNRLHVHGCNRAA